MFKEELKYNKGEVNHRSGLTPDSSEDTRHTSISTHACVCACVRHSGVMLYQLSALNIKHGNVLMGELCCDIG